MKKIIGIGILILGLMSGCSTTEQLAMKSLYSVTNNERTDIRGTIKSDRFLLYKKVSLTYNDVVTLDKFTQNDSTVYSLTAQYLGPDWRFMDTKGWRYATNITRCKSIAKCQSE